MGRFHPIWPLSVTDGIHSEPVMHLCRELTDPPRGWQQVLQYRWQGSPSLLPGAPIGDQDGIGQVTRAWHAGIQDAHAFSTSHMLLTIACLLSLGMPWMPPGREFSKITSLLLPPGSHYQATFPSKAVDIGRYLATVVISALSARVNLLPGPYSSYSVNSWPEYPSYSWPPPSGLANGRKLARALAHPVSLAKLGPSTAKSQISLQIAF